MTDLQENKESDETKNELILEIKEMNKRWYQKTWLFILSLILGASSFIGGFYVNFESTWQSAVQSIFFLLSIGFFVLVFSYLFNVTWLYVQKEKSDREHMLSALIQIASILAFVINIILISIRFTSQILLTDVRGTIFFMSKKYDLGYFSWAYLFSGDKYWFSYHLGIEDASTFTILIVVYIVISVILAITSYFTLRKIKQPFNWKEHIHFILQSFISIPYGCIVLGLYIKNMFSSQKVKISKSKYFIKFKTTIIFILVPIIFLSLFFALYFLSNFSYEYLFDLPWPLMF